MDDEMTRGGPPVIPGLTYEALLGSGGFADVYRYHQEALGRGVAVKVLHGLGEVALDHFRAEAHVMARLSNHPSIVTIHAVGEADDGRPYLVMQLCPPPHLGDRIRTSGGLPVAQVLEAGVQLAGAVETSHRLGILHRDIKPANILCTEFRRPVLADFGIAESTALQAPLHAYSPAWSPPEQVAGGAASPQADVYSLCATLWAMLTGAAPPVPLLSLSPSSSQSTRVKPELGRDDVPPALVNVLLTGLAADPAHRYRGALDLARELQRVQQDEGLMLTPVELWDGDGAEDVSAPHGRDDVSAAPAQNGPAGVPDVAPPELVGHTNLVPLEATASLAPSMTVTSPAVAAGPSVDVVHPEHSPPRRRGPLVVLAGLLVALVVILGLTITTLWDGNSPGRQNDPSVSETRQPATGGVNQTTPAATTPSPQTTPAPLGTPSPSGVPLGGDHTFGGG